jgi:hypothetical protein
MRILVLFSFLFFGLENLPSQAMVTDREGVSLPSTPVSGRRSLAEMYPLSATPPQLERLASLAKMARAAKKTVRPPTKKRSFSTDCDLDEEDLGYISTADNSPSSIRRSSEKLEMAIDLAADQLMDQSGELTFPFSEMAIESRGPHQASSVEEELLFPFDEGSSAFSPTPENSLLTVPLSEEELLKEKERQKWYRDQINFQNLLYTNPELFPQVRSHMHW